nr:ATP-binding cassette domain-containing protein [Clostridia bacterium]
RIILLDGGRQVFCGTRDELESELKNGNVPENAVADLPLRTVSSHAAAKDGGAAGQGGKAVLRASGLCFSYGESPILRELSLELYEGEFLCVCGENGCGKTTLLRLLSGLEKPAAGRIELFGKKLLKYSQKELYTKTLKALWRDCELLFSEDSVEKELTEAAKLCGAKKADAVAFMSDLSLPPGRHPYDLSGGERQLLALSILLLEPPKLLLLDEPTVGMDARVKKLFFRRIRELCDGGMSVVCVTHDLDFASLCADRCALMSGGEIVCCEPTREFFDGNLYYRPHG